MSKKNKVSPLEETEVIQATGIPAQEPEGMGVSLAMEIIADQKKEIEQLKKKLAEAKEDRDLFCEQRLVLMLQMDIFNTAIKIDDVSLLKMALGMMNGVYNRQSEKEQEGEKNAEM